MGITDIFKRSKPVEKKRSASSRRRVSLSSFKKGYQAAQIDRLTSGWTTQSGSSNADIYAAIKVLRARSRDLAYNNDYARRFITLCKNNIIGPHGIGFQVRAKNEGGAFKGQYDEFANNAIEAEFRKWTKAGIPTVDGTMSWVDAQKLAVESVARDGECLIQILRGWRDNDFRYALRFVEADHLDEDYNTVLKDGSRIIMGVEVNKWHRPLAYHIKTRHPGEMYMGAPQVTNDRIRIPAEDIIHLFVKERIDQTRGVGWMASAMYRMQMLNGYEQSELVAARTAAAKMGFFTSPDGEGYEGEDTEDDEGFEMVTTAEPGTFEQLPTGYGFQSYDPQHPVQAYEAFVLACIRGISSGLGVSYVSLANDLRAVSYSSIRQGALDERDAWMGLQQWTIDHLVGRVVSDWLKMLLTIGKVNLPLAKFDKFNDSIIYRPRSWQWVDPEKEVNAGILAVNAGFRTLQGVMGPGIDFYDTINELAAEKAAAERAGLTLTSFTGAQNATEKAKPKDDDEEDKD